LKPSNVKLLPNEPCLHYRSNQGTLTLIALYVVDLVIAGTVDAVKSVTSIMLGKYKIKDLGKLHLILECEVLYDEAAGDYSVNHRHHVIDLCEKYLPHEGARVQKPICQRRH